MDQRIYYVTAADRVRLAYSVSGSGPPVLFVGHLGLTHLGLDLETSPFREWFEAISSRYTLIRYDHRGTGLSDRTAPDFGIVGRLRDLEAIISATGLQFADLIARSWGCFPAVEYAVRHPQVVSRLLLIDPELSAEASLRTPQRQLLVQMVDRDWVMYTEVAASLSFGWAAEPEGRGAAAAMIRESLSPEAWKATIAAASEYDMSASLGEVQAPVFVLFHAARQLMAPDSVRDVGSMIPRAAVHLNSGRLGDNPEEDARVLLEYLTGESLPPTGKRDLFRDGSTATILFLDIADSTPLTERLGDVAFRAQSRQLEASLREIIVHHGGTPMDGKVLGDGLMATYASASRAIVAALACNEAASKTDLSLHLGIHAGDVIHEQGNVYGGAVNMAARVCATSAPGEVLVSETVRALARTSAGVRFEDRGLHELKGIEEPQRLFAVVSG